MTASVSGFSHHLWCNLVRGISSDCTCGATIRQNVKDDTELPNTVTLAFWPGSYVRVTHLGLNYKGRVTSVTVRATEHEYNVEYADDGGNLKTWLFKFDELELSNG